MVKPKLDPDLTGWRAAFSHFVEGKVFVAFITLLILINAVTLGLETDKDMFLEYGALLKFIDRAILIVFTVELTIKFLAYRLGFFKSGWNIFDLLIVTIAWVPASGALSVLRALRILRVLRLISVVPQMRRVIGALLHSIPSMLSVMGVLSLLFYVAAVLATKLYGQHPDPNMQEWFGSISASAYTLFQIMTLESWSMGIVRPTMELFPLAWIFFVPFIIITSFAVLNLFIGIMVDAMSSAQEEPRDQAKQEIKDFTADEIAIVLEKLELLKKDIQAISNKKKA